MAAGRIVYLDAASTQGRMTWEGGDAFGPLPPADPEMRAVYDRLIAAGVVPERYTPPAVSVPDISDSQFAQGLWRAGIITYADVLAFAGPGKIPDPLLAIIAGLPDDDTGQPTPRKLATADLTGRKVYQFANPLVEYVRVAMEKQDPKWTPDYLRQQWALWATL